MEPINQEKMTIEDKRYDLMNAYNEEGCRLWSDTEIYEMSDHRVELLWDSGEFEEEAFEDDRSFEATAWFLGGLIVGMLIVGLVSCIF